METPLLATKPLVLAWWNTSLSPLVQPRKPPVNNPYVLAFVSNLVKSLEVDILGLGEVSSQDVKSISRAIGNPDLTFHDATLMEGKRLFDIAVAFNQRRLILVDSGPVLDALGTVRLKASERLKFVSLDANEYLHLFVSHWTSRRTYAEMDQRRNALGHTLRRSLNDVRSHEERRQFIVLMGDYNDDPCSPSLADCLLATRDRDRARKHDEFLYNPFWRQLGEAVPFLQGQMLPSICGTHFYAKSSGATRWFTYDQMMFSSAFLGDGPLVLNEKMTGILRDDDLESRIRRAGDIHDHMPIVGTIDIRRMA